MYEFLLVLHSAVRWIVVLAGLHAVGRAMAGAASRRNWTTADLGAGRLFVVGLDVQLVVGLLLYGVFSPFVSAALGNMAVAMKSSDLRYWSVEHPLMMTVALGLAHVGLAKTRRTNAPAAHRQALIFFGLAMVLILAATPWPFMPNGRGLLPRL